MISLLFLGAVASMGQGDAGADPARPSGNVAAAVGEAVEPPLVFDIRYKADVLAVVAGGNRRGVRYLDNLDVTLAADLDRLAGIPRTRAFVYGLYNNGTSFSASLAGDAQILSNIETGVRAVRLYEGWIEHGDDALSARIGLYDINSEFDMLETSTLFINSAHGVGTDLSQSGNNGPSIFPVTAPGVRVQGQVTPALTLRAAILGGTPGDPDHPGRTIVRLRQGDGAFLLAEADLRVGVLRLLTGAWRYTARFAAQADPTVQAHGNGGAYLRGEAPLADNAGRNLSGFFRLGVASGRFNIFDRFASAGLTLTGVRRAGGSDALGLAVAHARTADDLRALTPGMTRGETSFELTYRTRVARHLWVQPNVQYVIDPSAMNSPRNTWVVGARLEARLRP